MTRTLLLLAAALPGLADTSPRAPAVILGRWTFDNGDARDGSGFGADGRVQGNVAFRDGCAIFKDDGYIEVPVRGAGLREGYRTLDIEVRAYLENPHAYYATLFSHPLVTVAVNALGSTKGRPCFTMANLKSVLAPDETQGDKRWGRGPRLNDETDCPFYYWAWVGHGSVVVPAGAWVTIRTVYDGRNVTQSLDGKVVATHGISNEKSRVCCDPENASKTATIGRLMKEGDTPTGWTGKIDYVIVRATR